MNAEVIAVGQQYPFDLPASEGAVSDFLRPSGNRLLVGIHDITREEEKAFKKGEIRCGLLAKDGAILFLWKFTDKKTPIFTFDSPFDARLIKDIQLYDVHNSETRIVVDIHVVDMSNNNVRCLRAVTMPPGLTIEFLSAVQDQIATQNSGKKQVDNWMNKSPDELTHKTQMWLMGK